VRFWVAHWCISEGRIWLERALMNHEAVTPLVRIKALSGAVKNRKEYTMPQTPGRAFYQRQITDLEAVRAIIKLTTAS